MSVYNELLSRIVRTYRDAGNNFHPADAAAKITAALGDLQQPFETLGGAIDKQRAGLFPNAEAYKAASGDPLRILDADLDVLKAAVANAARADKAKVARVIVDQSVAVRQARVQQAADGDMVNQVSKLIDQARGDAKAAGEIPAPGGGTLPRLGEADVNALKGEIAARAAPKEDKIAAEQIARIGGQIEPD
jgi:hypothetical protein